jgi:hypothetical protein
MSLNLVPPIVLRRLYGILLCSQIFVGWWGSGVADDVVDGFSEPLSPLNFVNNNNLCWIWKLPELSAGSRSIYLSDKDGVSARPFVRVVFI